MAIKAKAFQKAKIEAVEQAKSLFEGYSDYIFANFRGLTVGQITTLRKQLRAKESALKVVKNNFARIAFEQMKIDSVGNFLTGPTAIALSKTDTNDVAKILYDFVREAPALEIKGGYVSNEVYDAAKLEAFSKLPGKKQLISMIMSAINGPAQKLAATIQAYADKMISEGAVPANAPLAEETAAEKVVAKSASSVEEEKANAPAEAPAPEAQQATDPPAEGAQV
jgi:large subunit ribosomal protein L10